MKTIKGNKLIAEFMGDINKLCHDNTTSSPYNYHSSWDWLMPVVEQCTRIGYANDNEEIDAKWESIFGDNDSIFLGNHIDEVWEACVEFIQWYNENK